MIWALVPWLDRAAARDERSPEFSDLGIAAIIFLTFLTLKAWDVGGELGVDSPENLLAYSGFDNTPPSLYETRILRSAERHALA